MIPFFDNALVGTSATTVLAPSSSSRRIDMLTVLNDGAAAVTLDAWIVPQGATVSTPEAQVYAGKSVAAGQTLILSALIGHILPKGASLILQCSADLAVQVSGRAS